MERLSAFADLLADAYRAAVALDDEMAHDAGSARSAAVSEALRVYSQLLDYRKAERMTVAQACTLETASEVIRAQLRHLGYTLNVLAGDERNPPR